MRASGPGAAAGGVLAALLALSACTGAAVSPARARPAATAGPATLTPLPGQPQSGQARPAGSLAEGGARARWVASWSASPQRARPRTLAARGLRDQTVRDVVFTSAGGTALRVELTNVYGTRPLRAGAVSVGLAGPGATVQPGTLHAVTFGRGARGVVIPAGRWAWSDPVPMTVPALTDLAVSVYVPQATGPATTHVEAHQTNWVSARGDQSGQSSGAGFTTGTPSWFFAAGLAVRTATAAGTVVAFGDSITDGTGSTSGANDRWPNLLARRLQAARGPALAVTDAGIGGNRLLTGWTGGGAAGVARFTRDALDQPGVTTVIVLEGVNDILVHDRGPGGSKQPGFVTAAQLIAGYKKLIAAAHARGVRVVGATILPFKGLAQYTPAAGQVRDQVNRWILTSGAFDGVIGFAAAVQEPGRPAYLNPADSSGDHLHPDDAGYAAMAAAVDPGLLLAGA